DGQDGLGDLRRADLLPRHPLFLLRLIRCTAKTDDSSSPRRRGSMDVGSWPLEGNAEPAHEEKARLKPLLPRATDTGATDGFRARARSAATWRATSGRSRGADRACAVARAPASPRPRGARPHS